MYIEDYIRLIVFIFFIGTLIFIGLRVNADITNLF